MRNALNDTGVLRAVLDKSSDMVAISDAAGRVLYINPVGLALVGLTELSQIVPVTTDQFLTSSGLALVSEMQLSLKHAKQWHGLSELKNFATKSSIPVEITAFVIDRPRGEPSVIVSIVRDGRNTQGHEQWQAIVRASDYRAAEQEAVARLSRLALAGGLDELLDAATTAASALMGVDRCMITRPIDGDAEHIAVVAFTGQPPRLTKAPAGHQSLMGYTMIANSVVVCADGDEETRFSTVAMASFGFRSGVGVPIPGGGSSPWGALSIHSNHTRIYSDRDVSFLQTVTDVLSAAIRRLDLDRQLRERSMRDPLTGLANRTHAYERLDQALARAKRDGTSVAVLALDIDEFKIINDSLGHEAGDRALVRVATCLAAAARPGDTVARMGGDEFLVVCEDVDGIGPARNIARELADAVNRPHPAGPHPTALSTSIGIAISTVDSTREAIVHHADLAMYRAKDAGAGGSAVFDHGDLYDAERTRRLSVDLRAALGEGELNLLYQPIVDIATGTLVAFEGLARWRHPDLGVIDPTEFVAVAERTGLVGALGEWALHSACLQAVAWRTFTDVGVRVNVSALQLRDPAFATQVAAVLASTGLDPAALGLEITETVAVSDTPRVAGILTELHDMGIALSLDDLGSGYSSIAYLSRYPVFDCFKIDRSYIEGLPAARPTAIVTAIVMLARAFDLTVVGEGVETVEQLDTLRACGCDLAQGFLLGKPMTADQAATKLRNTPSAEHTAECAEPVR